MVAPSLQTTAVRLVLEAAAEHVGIEPALLKGLAHVESTWNPKAKSHAGAKGLTQLMPITAKEVGCSDPYDAMQNALGGAIYLKKQLKRFGNLRHALAAYNWGPRNVAVKHLQNGGALPEEVQTYVDRVLQRRDLERMQSPPGQSNSLCDLCGRPAEPRNAAKLPTEPPPKKAT